MQKDRYGFYQKGFGLRQDPVWAILFDKSVLFISAKYFDYCNIFSTKNAAKLLKHIRINAYTIKLKNNTQPLFELIYSLRLVDIETLDNFIKTNMASGFIQSSKFYAKDLINSFSLRAE